MPDIITALHKKRQDLVSQKSVIRAEYEYKLTVADEEIKRIDKALETLNAAVQEYLCPIGMRNVR